MVDLSRLQRLGRTVGLGMITVLMVTACGGNLGPGTAWGEGAFRSNGERIYFTGTSERDGTIDYTGGPGVGGMMMAGRLSCASCHGVDAKGGVHMMHMELMDAPDIRWAALAAHEAEEQQGDAAYDLDTFARAVVDGQHPDGDALDPDMPRWQMSSQDVEDLAGYLQSLSDD